MRLKAEDAERQNWWTSICGLWQQSRLCDVVLQSRDGSILEAHRLVLAAASPALSALVDGCFAEARGGPIKFDVSHGTLTSLIRYLYDFEIDLQPSDALELLSLSHMYGLNSLQEKVAMCVAEDLNADTATAVLTDVEVMGLRELQQRCEVYIAQHYELCTKKESFLQISASQFGRLLGSPALTVSREEVVLESLLQWSKAAPNRETPTQVLFQLVRFPAMSLSALEAVKAYAQNAGPLGLDLEREANRGLEVHHHGACLDDDPPVRRRCFAYWWSGLGASASGGTVVAGTGVMGEGLDQFYAPRCMVLHEGALFIADRLNKRVVRWRLGAAAGHVVAGQGAAVDGITDFGEWIAIAVSAKGELFVADRDNDRIVCFGDAGGEQVGKGLWQISRPYAVAVTPGGAIYVCDNAGCRVQKLDGEIVTTVAGGNGIGPAANQFRASVGGMFVTDSGVIYICDPGQDRVQRWLPGAHEAVTVAGGNGRGQGLNQLSEPTSVVVAPNGDLYISDTLNQRVVKWPASACSGVIVAGGHGEGAHSHQLSSPTSMVHNVDGTIFVCEHLGHRISKWGPPAPIALWDI